MKSRKPFLSTLAAAALLAATTHLPAQSWQTVENFQHTVGLSAVSADMGTDPSGNIYAVGSGITTTDGSGRVALVNVSSDQGLTWTTLPEFSEPGWPWAHYRAFTSDATGRLFVGGNGQMANRPSSDLAWIIRESVDGGANWFASDDSFPFPGDTYAGCADIKVHPVTGDVYASGSSLNYGRVIRKRAAGATEFTTVYSSGPSDIGSGWAIGFHPSGSVIVPGDRTDPVTHAMKWIVLRSATGNLGNWQTVDTFITGEWTGISSRGVLVTGNGTIYASGWAYSSRTRKNHWIVRTSADGGTTWSISDSFSYGGSTVEVNGMTQNAAGNLFVCGKASNSTGKFYWLVRKGTFGTKLVKQGGKWVQITTLTWSTSDVFQLASGKEAQANGITADASGNVLVSGRAQDAAGIEHWIVRKLTP